MVHTVGQTAVPRIIIWMKLISIYWLTGISRNKVKLKKKLKRENQACKLWVRKKKKWEKTRKEKINSRNPGKVS